MALTLKAALSNYRAERLRLQGCPHPRVGCGCSFCELVRAADLVFNAGQALQASIDRCREQQAAGRRALPQPDEDG